MQIPVLLNEVNAAYVKACKERDKRTMELYRLRNPSVVSQQKSSLLFTTLVQAFGETDGKREWMKYVHTLRDEKKRLQVEHGEFKTQAQICLRILKALRKGTVIYTIE